jgi:hypothetical protein
LYFGSKHSVVAGPPGDYEAGVTKRNEVSKGTKHRTKSVDVWIDDARLWSDDVQNGEEAVPHRARIRKQSG